MSKLDDLRKQIKAVHTQALGQRVLLVEGIDDEQAFSSWLNKRSPGWENSWAVAPAGRKADVLALLALEPDWLGVVDRDEWSVDTIAEKTQALPNLWVLPRFCLENYLCDPDELWAMLPLRQQLRIESNGSNQQALADAVTQHLPLWCQHGALWQVANPLQAGLQALGFKDRLLNIRHAGNEQVIRQTLNEWHRFLEPEPIWAAYQTRLAEVNTWSAPQQLSGAVHGKHFFQAVITPVLNQLLGQARAEQHQKDLLKHAQPPADLQPLWQRMNLP